MQPCAITLPALAMLSHDVVLRSVMLSTESCPFYIQSSYANTGRSATIVKGCHREKEVLVEVPAMVLCGQCWQGSASHRSLCMRLRNLMNVCRKIKTTDGAERTMKAGEVLFQDDVEKSPAKKTPQHWSGNPLPPCVSTLPPHDPTGALSRAIIC